jgi:DSF synthase
VYLADDHKTPVMASGAGGPHQDSARRASPSLQFSFDHYRELDVRYEEKDRTLWCATQPIAAPCFTVSMIAELKDLQDKLLDMTSKPQNFEIPRFFVLGSNIPGIFNLGGDLKFFIESIETRNMSGLRKYAHACVEFIYNLDQGFSSRMITVCLVEGDALGGGLESALSFNVLIAERGAKMGLPETLFNAFPGMGAYSLLSRKVGMVEAERMIMSGKVYQSEELHEMGIVTILAEPGTGKETVRRFIHENSDRHGLLLSLNRARRRTMPMNYDELEDITDIWVEHVMELTPKELRRMVLLAKAQLRRTGES